ncbi:NAD-binding protein [Candidatus Palauibacter sp.]|uniref:NAD-binding protein n=1 Tax=Candidatus Palauibacter sp. TaxID=3101350 RepID=UPI003AF30E92
MRIVIAGAGQVGFHLAEKLSRQGQDVTVVDADPERGEHREHRPGAGRLELFTVLLLFHPDLWRPHGTRGILRRS